MCFEARLMRTQADVKQIAIALDRWDADGSLQADPYDGELAYYRDCYFQDGGFMLWFAKLDILQATSSFSTLPARPPQ